MSKRCTGCYEVKPLDSFYKQAATRDGRQSWCKECQQTHTIVRRHLTKNTWSITELLRMLYGDQPCTDCGQTFKEFCQLTFDHLDPDAKDIDIASTGNVDATEERYLEVAKELEGCELVCHNCHQLRTHQLRREISAHRLNKAYDHLKRIGRLYLWTRDGKREKKLSSSATKRAKTAEAATLAQPTAMDTPSVSVVRHTPRARTSKTVTTPTLKTATTSRSTSED